MAKWAYYMTVQLRGMKLEESECHYRDRGTRKPLQSLENVDLHMQCCLKKHWESCIINQNGPNVLLYDGIAFLAEIRGKPISPS